jgi:hypothetical protein
MSNAVGCSGLARIHRTASRPCSQRSQRVCELTGLRVLWRDSTCCEPGRLAVRPKACGSTHSRLSLNLTALAGGVSLVLEMAEISSLERLCVFFIPGNRFAARFWLVC